MNTISYTLTSLTGRTLIYISVFILGAALHELCFQLMHPMLGNHDASLTVITLAIFVLAGALLACKGRILSRVASASTLLVLGFIALRIGHASISDSYLLVAALIVAMVGAHPFLHRKVASTKQLALYGMLTVFAALVVAVVFAYAMIALDRIALQR